VKPASPITWLILVIGFGAGLLLGFVMAFLRERLDDHIRGRHDLELTSGAPVLASVPTSRARTRDLRAGRLAVMSGPSSPVAESYRALAASISFLAANRGIKTIVVTSPAPIEGKSAAAGNLGLLLAEAGRRVMLVSADMRVPVINRFFGTSNTVGLSSVLNGDAQLADAVQHPQVQNLRILPAGPVPQRPTEALQSQAMVDIIESLEQSADFVILDAPPVLIAADVLALAPLVHGALLVGDAKRTTRTEVIRSREQLEQVGVRIIGAVLDNMDRRMAKEARTIGYATHARFPFTGPSGNGHVAPVRKQPELETPREGTS
jgi:tyrosine-protein kinase